MIELKNITSVDLHLRNPNHANINFTLLNNYLNHSSALPKNLFGTYYYRHYNVSKTFHQKCISQTNDMGLSIKDIPKVVGWYNHFRFTKYYKLLIKKKKSELLFFKFMSAIIKRLFLPREVICCIKL